MAGYIFGASLGYIALQILEVFREWLERNHSASGILSRNIDCEQTNICTGVDNHFTVRGPIKSIRVNPLNPDFLYCFKQSILSCRVRDSCAVPQHHFITGLAGPHPPHQR